MLKLLVSSCIVITLAYAGVISQESDEGGHIDHHSHSDHDHRPTSYQRIHIVHHHPVPTFIRKEFNDLLEHPVSAGSHSSSLEVHHGDKHDQGYAFFDGKSSNNAGYGGHDEASSANDESSKDEGQSNLGHYGYAGYEQGESSQDTDEGQGSYGGGSFHGHFGGYNGEESESNEAVQGHEKEY